MLLMEKLDFHLPKDNNKIQIMDIRLVKTVIASVLMASFIILTFMTQDQIYSHLFTSMAIIFGVLAISSKRNSKRVN